MAYQIIYGKNVIHKKIDTTKKKGRYRTFFFCTALVLLLCIGWFGWHNPTIRYWLLPGDPQVTDAALQQLVEEIRKGEPLADAITAFCEDIISGAKTVQ